MANPMPASGGLVLQELKAFISMNVDAHDGIETVAPVAKSSTANPASSSVPPSLPAGGLAAAAAAAAAKARSTRAADMDDDELAEAQARARADATARARAAEGVKPKAKKVASRKLGGGGEACAACGKTAYLAERKQVSKLFFHNDCFCCTTCGKKLGEQFAITADESGIDRLYCLTHERQVRLQAGLGPSGQPPDTGSSADLSPVQPSVEVQEQASTGATAAPPAEVLTPTQASKITTEQAA